MTPTTEPRVGLRPDPTSRHRLGRGNAAIIAAGVLVTLGVLMGGMLTVVAAFESQQADADQATIRAALTEAVVWQQTYGVEHHGFTADRQALADLGWQPAFDVDVHLVSADVDGFCMAAGPIADRPTLWADQDGPLADQPCE
jgi:hypothetical protein